MGLIAHLDAMLVSPGDPLLGKVLEQQVGERLAVVSQYLVAIVYYAQQFGQMLTQVIATTLLELVEQRGSPVGTIHLVRIIKERVRIWHARRCKGLFETLQIVADSVTVEVVDHPAFTARCSALYLLFGAADVHGVDGGTVYQRVFEDGFAGGLFQGNVRSAERPARAAVHVNLNIQRMPDVLYRFQCLHPLWRQEGDIVFVVVLHAIERGNLYSSDTHTGIFTEVPPQVLLVDGRAQPPPTRAGLGFMTWRRPGLSYCCCKTAAH